MREAVVVASSRTPLGKSYRGSLNLTRPDDMIAHCLKHVMGKVPQVALHEIEDVIIGCAYPEGPQGDNVARVASLRGGLSESVAAVTVNRFCSSGLQATAMAAHQIIHEGADVAIGGGVESVTMFNDQNACPNPWVKEHWPGIYMVMGDTAEIVAKKYGISRQAQDEFALGSQLRTAHAQQQECQPGSCNKITVPAFHNRSQCRARPKFSEGAGLLLAGVSITPLQAPFTQTYPCWQPSR